MRARVESGGFFDAADACRTANQIAALLCESLSGKLAGFGSMAGDDATSQAFAESYDAGAAEAVGALADLVDAFVGVGRLLSASGVNHDEAEAASAAVVSGYSGGHLDDDDFVRVSIGSPPTSLGATPPHLGTVEAFILGQIEGFVWPGAEVEVLLDAGSVWRRTASAVGDLDDQLAIAATLLERQESPEIPIASSVIAELRGIVAEVADAMMALADSCEEYAAAVRDTHERTLDLLGEIARMVVEGAAISVIIGGLTGGLGGGAAGSAALARISAQAPRFHALLDALRISGATTAARLRTVRESMSTVRLRVEKFAKVRVRNERGSFRLPGGRRPTFEGSPKHTYRPVGRASAEPRNAQEVLEESIAINPSSTTRRVGYDPETQEFAVFDETTDGFFHGHVRDWSELTHGMQRALVKAGVVDRKGRPVAR